MWLLCVSGGPENSDHRTAACMPGATVPCAYAQNRSRRNVPQHIYHTRERTCIYPRWFANLTREVRCSGRGWAGPRSRGRPAARPADAEPYATIWHWGQRLNATMPSPSFKVNITNTVFSVLLQFEAAVWARVSSSVYMYLFVAYCSYRVLALFA